METQDKIKELGESLIEFLQEKNKNYGDAALDPVDIFLKVIDNEKDMAIKGILIRVSDKLSRIKNNNVLRKNDIADIIGYFMLLMVKKGWTDLEDLID